MTAVRSWTPIDRLATEWVDTLAGLSPTFATYAGLPADQAGFDDFSPEGGRAFVDAAAAVLRRLTALPPVDRADEITRSGLEEELGLAIEVHESGWPMRDLNNIESAPQIIRDVFDLMPRESAEDWELIAARMAAVPAALRGYVETLRAGIAAGITPARRQVEVVLAQLAPLGGKDSFFLDLASSARAGLPTRLHRALESAATSAVGAYADFARFLREEEAPAGTARDGVGREFYSLLSRRFVGARVDLDETYEWGLDELARMAAEQDEVAGQILPGADVADAVAFLDEEGADRLVGTDALREWMQGLADTAIAELGRDHFDIPAPVRALECLIAPTATGGIYYTAPSDDFSRPGRMWWSVPADVTTFSTWRETTTVYHEGVPGHHLQLGMSVYLRESLNPWRRLASGSSGFFEGWALYAERLMDDLGYLTTPADRLGMLDGQRMRAARVVLDIGVHLGKARPDGGMWDGDVALDFFRSQVNLDPSSSAFEVNRYLGWPGQAPSYKIGQRVWEQVRDDYLRTHPAATLADFHREALSLGSLTLDGLRRALATV